MPEREKECPRETRSDTERQSVTQKDKERQREKSDRERQRVTQRDTERHRETKSAPERQGERERKK